MTLPCIQSFFDMCITDRISFILIIILLFASAFWLGKSVEKKRKIKKGAISRNKSK